MENKKENSFSPLLLLFGLLVGGILLFLWIRRRNVSNNSAVNEDGKLFSEVVAEEGGKVINGRHEIMLDTIRKKPGISTPALQDVFRDVTDRTLRRDLNKLIDLGIIRKEGSTKSSKYYVI